MFDRNAQTTCVKAVRAAFARTLADREGLAFARPNEARAGDVVGKPHLSMVRFAELGYPMGDSLIPLAELWDKGEVEPPGDEPEGEPQGITRVDESIDEARADLYDRLLNLSPGFEPFTSVNFGANPVLNIVYGEVLRTARFAGAVASQSPEAKKARVFLFPEDENGLPQPSAVYARYKEFEAEVEDLMLQIADARSEGRPERADLLSARLTRTRTEWRELGRKAEVEAALATIEKSNLEAGFEDERRRFLEILEARTRARLSSALDYALVRISPLAPLIDPDAASHWTTVSLDPEELRAALDPRTRRAFDLSTDEVASALKFVREARFSYTPILLDREWLREDFLTARYWSHDKRVISDGAGGGEAPTVASRAFFVRSGGFAVDLGLTAEEGKPAEPGKKLQIMLHEPTAAPLLAKLARAKPEMAAEKRAVRLTAGTAVKMGELLQRKERESEKERTDPKILFHNVAIKNEVSVGAAPLAELRNKRISMKLAAAAPSSIAQAVRRSPRVQKPSIRKAVKVEPKLARPARQATVRVSGSNVRDHRKRVRVRARDITTRDHREKVRVRVRGSKVRDHRERVRVKARRGSSAKVPGLKLKGQLRYGDGLKPSDIVATLVLMAAGRAVGEEAVPLTRQSAGELQFSREVSSRLPRRSARLGNTLALSSVIARLRHGDEVLLERRLEFGDKTRTETLNWTVRRETAQFELSSAVEPTLMAYALEILPLAPNPDEELEW